MKKPYYKEYELPKHTIRDLFRFWFSRKRYTRKKIYFSGKMRLVLSETLDFVQLQGIKKMVPKQLLHNYGIFKED